MSKSDSPVAIVTGAGRGLGREPALALARAGYAVEAGKLMRTLPVAPAEVERA